MLKPASKLSRLALRSKLLLLAALPLLPLAAASYLFVVDSIQARSTALAEQDEISRIEAASSLGSALIVERDALQQSNTLGVRLRLTRQRTDEAIEEYRRTLDNDPGRTATVEVIETEINWIRQSLGDAEATVEMQQQALSLPESEAASVFQRLNQLVDLSIAEIQVTPGTIQTNDGLINARSVLLLTEFSAGLRSELVEYVAIGEAESAAARRGARSRATAYWDEVEVTTEEILAHESPEFIYRFQTEVLNSRGYGLVNDLRDGASRAMVDPEIAPSASFLPTFTPLFGAVQSLEADLIADSSEQATATANRALFALAGTVLAALLFAGLTLGLVVALYRSIRTPLLSLTEQSRQIAKHQLPTTVAQIRELGGEAVVEVPDPLQVESDDEIGELVDAFNQLHTTAIELAAEQAASRRTVSEMFVNLGRRNQKILMRLLASLDKLERNERDPDLLQELFKVDHLATRMRRNAESLLVLAGAKTSRSFGEAIPVADVVRSALSEVEDFDRVSVDDQGEALIHGKAVADVGHLLAELIENALVFSPPSSSVEVLIRRGPEGLMISVGDRGIGLSGQELEVNNRRIQDAAQLTETPSRFLGLYVVGRLAHRHGLRVELLNGVPSGLIARITFSESVYQAIGGPTQEDDVWEDRTAIAGAASTDTHGSTAPPLSAGEVIGLPSPVEESVVPPTEFHPPAPTHRRATPPVPMEPVGHVPTVDPPTVLPRRRSARSSHSIKSDDPLAPPPIEPTVSPNQNLAGFQRATKAAAVSVEPLLERRRQPPTPAPPTPSESPSQPTGPIGELTKRVPGASQLGRKSDASEPTQPEQPPTTLQSGPSVAARFGADLSGFQRGTERADTTSEPAASNVRPLAQPTAPPGELS